MSGAPAFHENVAPPAGSGPLARLSRALSLINNVIMALAGVAAIAAALVLSYSVLVRYVFKAPTYWQDEAAVFLLVGATFLTAAFVQEKRGHVGIEAFAELLSPAANRFRMMLVDVLSLAFCAFFSWKSWTLFHEAWVDGQVTSSTWAPPLWIPYSLMAAGMTLLSIQIALQIALTLSGGKRP